MMTNFMRIEERFIGFDGYPYAIWLSNFNHIFTMRRSFDDVRNGNNDQIFIDPLNEK